MLDVLSQGFRSAKMKFQGKVTLTEENVSDALQDVRRSLLEADVAYDVTKEFLKRVQESILGQIVQIKAGKSSERMFVSPGDRFVQACQTHLEELMGPVDHKLTLPNNRPGTIMMVGLQGSGKTTTTGKLTKYLQNKVKAKPLLVAADVYRPAAREQLQVLGEKVGAPVFTLENATPVEICKQAVAKAYELGCTVILYDTAGRLTIDDKLMEELIDIKSAVSPDNILLVCDAMMGQDAVTTAKAFDEKLDISGVIMTKLDGDARGGAALSIKEVLGKPIKFIGMGESLDNLEEFRPEGLASRILGMGDVVGLVQDFERVAEKDKEEEALRMLQGQFSFKDFYQQLSMIQKMGSLKDIAAKLPIQDMLPKGANFDDRELVKIKAMIDSMTEKERLSPSVLNSSRIGRIAKGSGRPPKEVNELIQKFKGMRQMMGMLGKNMGLLSKIPGIGNLAQLGQMKKMAESMKAGGSMPGLGGLGSMFGGGGDAGGQKRVIDREKLKKMRKAAKAARKKNRK